jgi:hypothetical protein
MGAGRIAAWFIPDMALVAAIVAVIWLLAEFGGATALFRDADAGWHIRTGERILATGTLPGVDPFSFSRPGAEWFAWEWAIDVLSGALHGALGLAGVAWFYALAIGSSVWMWFRLAWKVKANFLLACAFAAPMLSTVNLHWLARPHVVSWLFLLATVWVCERAVAERRDLLTVFLFAAAWANVHGSFFFAVLIPLVYAAGAWLSGLVWDTETKSSAFLKLALLAAAGTFVNPLGWRLHEHVFGYLANSALLDRIGEFQSFNFHAEGAAQIVLALMLGVAGGVAALGIGRVDRFLLAGILTAGALRSARLLPVAALLLLPLAAGSITSLLRSAQVGRRFRKSLDAFLAHGDGLRLFDRKLHGVALTPVIAVALLGILKSSHPAFPAEQFPVAASAAVEKLPVDARVFSSDKFGGYLIYRFSGTRRVFFDGRSDFYGADFLRQYAQVNQLRPGWHAQFDAWNFTHALVSPQAPLAEALRAAGWHELYRDKVAVLFARGGVS